MNKRVKIIFNPKSVFIPLEKNFLTRFNLIIFVAVFFGMVCLLHTRTVDADISEIELFTNPDKTISMDFQDADLKDVLKIFSQQAKLNFIASEAVQDRKVTLYLEKVPIKEGGTILTGGEQVKLSGEYSEG